MQEASSLAAKLPGIALSLLAAAALSLSPVAGVFSYSGKMSLIGLGRAHQPTSASYSV